MLDYRLYYENWILSLKSIYPAATITCSAFPATMVRVFNSLACFFTRAHVDEQQECLSKIQIIYDEDTLYIKNVGGIHIHRIIYLIFSSIIIKEFIIKKTFYISIKNLTIQIIESSSGFTNEYLFMKVDNTI